MDVASVMTGLLLAVETDATTILIAQRFGDEVAKLSTASQIQPVEMLRLALNREEVLAERLV